MGVNEYDTKGGPMQKVPKIYVAVPFRLLKERYLDALLEAGISPEVGLDSQSLDEFEPEDVSPIFQRLGEKGLNHTFHFPFVDLSPGSPDPLIREATRERFQESIRWVMSYRPDAVVVHTGYYPEAHGEILKDWIFNAVETFRWLGSELSKLNVPWSMENVFERSPQDLLSLLDHLKPYNPGICLDFGHITAFSKTPLVLWLELLHPYIQHLHIHDNKGHRDDHLGIGSGKIPFEGIFEIIKSRPTPLCRITLEAHQEHMVIPSLMELKRILEI